MKHALPPSCSNDLRVLLHRVESKMYMWSKGYEQITQRKLDELLQVFAKAVTFADDPATRATLQTMILQLDEVQSALRSNEPVDHQIAQKIVSAAHELRLARTTPLKPVAVEEVLGLQVIHFHYGLSTIGQIVRFQPANREKRAFGFIGEAVIRPCDNQQAMKDLFQGIYTQSDFQFLFDLYHWPADLPLQTFQEPGRPTDLVTIQWASHQGQDDDEDEPWEDDAVSPSSEEIPIVKTIREGEGDRRIGMRVFSIVKEMGGYLTSIEVYTDGFERWTVLGDDGKQMIDESDWFWLEISEYLHLFPARVLSQDDLSQKLREALHLKAEQAEQDDHDEMIQLQRRLDSLLKFLNGDIEDDKQQKRIATVYHNMMWSSASLDEAQREETVRQTAAKIERLRRIQL